MADDVWLEVPEWRAHETYADAMTDTPDPIEPDEFSEPTGDTPDDTPADEAPSIDDLLAGNIPDDDVEPVELDKPVEPVAGTRFPVMSVPQREPSIQGVYVPPPAADHLPREVFESSSSRQLRLEKEAMSRQERIRRGW